MEKMDGVETHVTPDRAFCRFKAYMLLCISVAFVQIWMVSKRGLPCILPRRDDVLKQACIFIFLARPG